MSVERAQERLALFVVEVQRLADSIGVSFALGAAVETDERGGYLAQVAYGRTGPTIHAGDPPTEAYTLAAMTAGALQARAAFGARDARAAFKAGEASSAALLDRSETLHVLRREPIPSPLAYEEDPKPNGTPAEDPPTT